MVDGIEFNWNDTINKYNDIDIKIKNQLLAAASSIFDLRRSFLLRILDFVWWVLVLDGVVWRRRQANHCSRHYFQVSPAKTISQNSLPRERVP
jgi:hypothetical protein